MIEDRRGTCAALALILAVSVMPLSVSAESRFALQGNLIAQNQTAQQNLISPKQAAAIAQQSTGGRVLSVDLAGQRVYRVKVLLDNSRVRTIRVDARSGEVQR